MENDQLWAQQMLEKVRTKIAWVTEKTKIKSPIPPTNPAVMTTAATFL